MIDPQEAKQTADMLSAVADPTRMSILHTLLIRPHYVGELADLLDIEMVNVSHHLSVLRKARIVEDEKNGRIVTYKLHPDIFVEHDGKGNNGSLQLGLYRLFINSANGTSGALPGGDGHRSQSKPPKTSPKKSPSKRKRKND